MLQYTAVRYIHGCVRLFVRMYQSIESKTHFHILTNISTMYF